MAAVASMMRKAPTGLNYGAVQRSSVGHINRLPRSNLQVKCIAKINTKFGELFAFSGPVPEIVNGRAAMLGFVSAIAVEAVSGRDLWSQLNIFILSRDVEWALCYAWPARIGLY